mmetsp:Transcript_63/g.235  ORF Transcript_63/g.235 Transcript_63/m.235 type:complete len:215 (-) Transcript_63:1471-2115(-)
MPPESFLVDEAALTAVRMAWRFWVVSQPRDSRYAASAKVSPGVISSVIERYETTFREGAGFDSAAEKAATAACGVAGAPGVLGVLVWCVRCFWMNVSRARCRASRAVFLWSLAAFSEPAAAICFLRVARASLARLKSSFSWTRSVWLKWSLAKAWTIRDGDQNRKRMMPKRSLTPRASCRAARRIFRPCTARTTKPVWAFRITLLAWSSSSSRS